MGLKPITISNFKGGLNLTVSSSIEDNQFVIAKNVFYNQKGQIQSRYGFKKFGNAVGSNKPVTSYHFFQRDDTAATQALCVSGTDMYKYNEVTENRTSIKSGLTEFETATGKTAWRTRRDFAVYKNVVYMCNGVDKYAGYDGSTYTEYATMPLIRYVNMNTDVIYGSGEDLNPSTLYYSGAAPADGSDFDDNAVVVGGDELGRINGMNELGNVMLIMKSGKIYSVNISASKAEPIDAQTGGYSDRSIANVGNSLVYLTDRGVDTLQPRTGVTGGSAMESKPLDADIREATTDIKEKNLNANAGLYVKRLSNYYISIDTDGNDIPDKTYVYNALTKGWSQYTYPNFYDYGFYIDSDGVYHYIASSAVTDQLYEIETGFTDDGESIEYELKTKSFDFGEPGTFKTYDYIDIIGQKSKGFDIEVTVEVDGVNVGGGRITDDAITTAITSYNLGIRPLGLDLLTGKENTATVDLYDYVARIPLYSTGSNINIDMKSTGGTWTLDKMRIGVNAETIDVFGYANIV